MQPRFVFARFWDEFVRLAVIGLFVAQIIYAAPSILALLSPLIQNPNWSYQQKMRARLGEYYDFTTFLEQHTPVDAVILLQPRPDSNLDPYFLYPRKLYYGSEGILRQHPEIEYIAIEGDFPSFSVDGEKVMLDSQHGLYRLRR